MILNVKIDPTKPILIAGPTGSGKSGLAMDLARKHGGTIVNADALQVYSCWRILTARPSATDEAEIPHLSYGHVGCRSPYSVGQWLREIAEILRDKDNHLTIIVGGTGLYFSALTNGLADIPDVPPEVREVADQRRASSGIAALLDDLQHQDAETLKRIDTKNPMRVQRAWEVWHATGKGLAFWHDQTPPPLLPPDQANTILLEAPKQWLTPRLNRRFRQMLDQGALEECRANMANWDPLHPSSQAIGARELIAYLQGATDLETAIRQAEIATRQYAKRQRSWFRARMQNWQKLDLSTGAA